MNKKSTLSSLSKYIFNAPNLLVEQPPSLLLLFQIILAFGCMNPYV